MQREKSGFKIIHIKKIFPELFQKILVFLKFTNDFYINITMVNRIFSFDLWLISAGLHEKLFLSNLDILIKLGYPPPPPSKPCYSY